MNQSHLSVTRRNINDRGPADSGSQDSSLTECQDWEVWREPLALLMPSAGLDTRARSEIVLGGSTFFKTLFL